MNDTVEKINPDHYVAVGFSSIDSVGLEQLLSVFPNDTATAFILVQDSSSSLDARMLERLCQHSRMPVYTAMEGLQPKANAVYVMPPQKKLFIVNGIFRVEDSRSVHSINRPIDGFFRSLAQDQGPRSIAVLFSSVSGDGSRGIVEIKEEGGLVLFQAPEDAGPGTLSPAALVAGAVDIVCSSEDLSASILRYIRHPLESARSRDSALHAGIEDSVLKEIFSTLEHSNQIDFSQYRTTTTRRRIDRRVNISGKINLADYLDLLKIDASECARLSKDMLIGVTRFFRDPEAFSLLEDSVIPALLEQTTKDSTLRIWVAGCSTGEEAYSIAIVLDEVMEKLNLRRKVKIFATDLDTDAIAVASAGQYFSNIMEDLSPERLNRYFTLSDDRYTVTQRLRQMVVFVRHNLIKDPPFSNIQFAVCRNVLIYFQAQLQRKVLSFLHFSLQKNGYLFLGTTETLGELKGYFSVIDESIRLFQKTLQTRMLTDQTSVSSSASYLSSFVPSVDQLLKNYQQTQRPPQYIPLLERLMEEYVPACMVLSETLEIVHVYGDVEPYTRKLRSGRLSSSIADFIVEDLSVAVSTVLHKALEDKKSVQYENVQFQEVSGESISLCLRVLYIKPKGFSAAFLALLFDPEKHFLKPVGNENISFANDHDQQRIHDLEQALSRKEKRLQTAFEEMEAIKEKLQSYNEALLSANEELQRTNEELQSLNEEIYTVNSEYQEKIEEVVQVNRDLDNIIKSVDVGIVFLDDAMRIRKFSPRVAQVIKVLPMDIGRPLQDISHCLIYDNFLNDIAFVLSKHVSRDVEVSTESGRRILIKIAPYYNEDNISTGCVVSLTDVSELRGLETQLFDSYAQLHKTVESAFLNEGEIKVLLVDDNQVDRMVVHAAFIKIKAKSKMVKYELVEASSFDQALELLQTQHFDVCLLDYNLAPQNGFELVERLSAKNEKTAFIMLSDCLEPSMYARAIELGIYDAIDKADISGPLLERSIRYAHRHRQTVRYLAGQRAASYPHIFHFDQ